MKKLLFALTLFSIMPLCAMKRKNPEKQVEKEECSEMEQEILDKILWESIRNTRAHEKKSKSIGYIEKLLKKGANPNAKSDFPCLFRACGSRIIRLLLDYEADIVGTNVNGETMFHYYPAESIALLLLHARERNIDLKKITSHTNKTKQTPLSKAEAEVRFLEANAGANFLPPNAFNFYDIDDYRNKLLILTDPNKHIPLLYPDMAKQFQEEQIEFRQKLMERELKKAGTQSIHQYLLNREIGRNRQTPWRN